MSTDSTARDEAIISTCQPESLRRLLRACFDNIVVKRSILGLRRAFEPEAHG